MMNGYDGLNKTLLKCRFIMKGLTLVLILRWLHPHPAAMLIANRFSQIHSSSQCEHSDARTKSIGLDEITLIETGSRPCDTDTGSTKKLFCRSHGIQKYSPFCYDRVGPLCSRVFPSLPIGRGSQ